MRFSAVRDQLQISWHLLKTWNWKDPDILKLSAVSHWLNLVNLFLTRSLVVVDIYSFRVWNANGDLKSDFLWNMNFRLIEPENCELNWIDLNWIELISPSNHLIRCCSSSCHSEVFPIHDDSIFLNCGLRRVNDIAELKLKLLDVAVSDYISLFDAILKHIVQIEIFSFLHQVGNQGFIGSETQQRECFSISKTWKCQNWLLKVHHRLIVLDDIVNITVNNDISL
jgi:hypothetical protein